MMPFDAYRCYLSLKNHFTKDHYDYLKYRGKTRATVQAFYKRKDRFWFEKFARQKNDKEVEELVQYAYEKAINILEYNNEAFTDLGQMLLDKKVVDSRDLIPIKITYHDTCDNENK